MAAGRQVGAVGGRAGGFTLAELLVVLLLASLLLGLSAGGIRSWRRATVLDRAGAAVRGTLARARMLATARGEVVRVRLAADGRLRLLAVDGSVLWTLALREPPLALDSVRLRPPWMRFNALGMAAPGSVHLYLDGRRIRVVCNFIGRVRIERSRV